MHQSLVFKKNLTERDFDRDNDWLSPQSTLLPAGFHESQQYADFEMEKEQFDEVCGDWQYDPLETTTKAPNQSDIENDSEGCNHDEYKQPCVIQKSAGGSLMGAGINAGTGKIVIVCTKCHTYYDAEGATLSEDV